MAPRLSALVALMFAVGLLPASSQAGLIVNGSFEQASVDPGNSASYLSGGSTAITGWMTIADGVDYVSSGVWQASDGQRSLDLCGGFAGGISQSFATAAGQSYSVLFDLAGNMNGQPDIKSVEVSAAGQSQVFNFNGVGFGNRNMGWVTMEFDFTATGALTTLTFRSLSTSPYGPALDNVRVGATAVPEPSTLALLAMGGLGLLPFARRKARNISDR